METCNDGLCALVVTEDTDLQAMRTQGTCADHGDLIYWSCGNSAGLHVMPDHTGWTAATSAPIEVYVR